MLFHFIERRAAAAPVGLAEHDVVGTGFAREHGIMTAEKTAGAGDAVGFQDRKRGDKCLYSADMGAIGAPRAAISAWPSMSNATSRRCTMAAIVLARSICARSSPSASRSNTAATSPAVKA